MRKLLLAYILCLLPTVAIAGTLTISGTSYSLGLDAAFVYMGKDQVKFLFTTYDENRYTYPYYFDATHATIYYSREMKKIGSSYYTDYYCLINGSIQDYGEISINLGSIDSDNNGIDDICESFASVNTSVTGNWYSHSGKSGAISGTIIKNSNSQHGYYNLLIKNTWAGDIAATGDLYAGTLSGTASYSNIDQSIAFEYSTTFDTERNADPFQTFFEIVDDNTVRIIGKAFFPTTTLIRYGNKYSATVLLSDGGLDTFWPDYQKWYIEIEDNNDIDKDGIPDLSDKQDNRKKVSLPFLPLVLE